jgi:hypothetical protein
MILMPTQLPQQPNQQQQRAAAVQPWALKISDATSPLSHYSTCQFRDISLPTPHPVSRTGRCLNRHDSLHTERLAGAVLVVLWACRHNVPAGVQQSGYWASSNLHMAS